MTSSPVVFLHETTQVEESGKCVAECVDATCLGMMCCTRSGVENALNKTSSPTGADRCLPESIRSVLHQQQTKELESPTVGYRVSAAFNLRRLVVHHDLS